MRQQELDRLTQIDRPCEYGLTYTEIQYVFPTKERQQEFWAWMRGQTGTLCREHGPVTYQWDVTNFINGGPVLD